MAKLKVEVVTPERRLVQLEADEVIAPGAEGLFGVRPGHAPFLSLLQAGPLTVKDGAKSELYFVAGGFVEVGGQNVRVLADSAQPQKEIDTAALAAARALGLTDAEMADLARNAAQDAWCLAPRG